MKDSYTIFNENSVKDTELISDDIDAAEFLRKPENFRPFNLGLLELLKRTLPECTIKNDAEASEYLIKALRAIDSDINPKTIRSWFSGEHRPKIEPRSRRAMYEICFALELSFADVQWFFHHVYFDRTFNCHNTAEVVFYFAFIHGLNYSEASKIIAEVNDAPEKEIHSENDGQIYTQLVKNRVLEFDTVDELKNFLIQNKSNFHSWNKTALNYIRNFFGEIIGNEEVSRQILQKVKRSIEGKQRNVSDDEDAEEKLVELNGADVNQFGLLMREILFDARDKNNPCKYRDKEIRNRISGKNIFSRTFVLDNLLLTFTGFEKKSDIPYVVKNNFPSKKILSDVLDLTKATTSESYDAIRKTLILFNFYIFWCRIKLDGEPLEREDLSEVYTDEITSLLEECGYEPLYAGNPYDWLFLCSINQEEPLKFFRSTVLGLLEDDLHVILA